MERKVVIRNVSASILLQLVTIVSGFVIPKIILNMFGSDVNGLVASINQFLSYISLLEGGVGGVIRAALYKPLREHDIQKVNSILKSAESFFRKIALVYVGYVLLLAIVYPRFVETGFNKTYSFLLVLILGANLFVQYYFSLTYKILLTADRKLFIVSLSQILIVFLNMVSVIICSYYFKDILTIKFFSAAIFVIQPVVYNFYVKKHYKIDKKAKKDSLALEQRWDGLGVNIAAFIHNNTDVAILTVFSVLSDVSIYAVYSMIVMAVKNLVCSVSSSIEPSFGRALAGNDENQKRSFFDKYAFIISSVTTIAFTCTMILITPFVDVYTKNITDADYHQVRFAFILTIAEMVYCFRDPYINVSYSSGKYKEISVSAFIEAGLNIIVSLALVWKYSYIGVAIGTLVAMTYRMLSQAYYVKKNILNRPIYKFYKSIAVYSVASIVSINICNKFVTVVNINYFTWAISAIKITLVTSIIVLMFCFFFYKQDLRQIIKLQKFKF